MSELITMYKDGIYISVPQYKLDFYRKAGYSVKEEKEEPKTETKKATPKKKKSTQGKK